MSTTKETSKGVLAARAILGRTVFLIITATLMFLAAGTLVWKNAWLYLSLFYGVMLLNVFVHLATNPKNLALHHEGHDKNQQDKKLVTAYNIMLFLFPAAAGLFYRVGFGVLPGWTVVVGSVILVVATLLALWAIRVNRYFEVDIKVQSTDHQVITTGPYQLVRHPGYISSILMWFATPLILQSSYLFVFSLLFTLFFIARTQLEDKYLVEKLKGYASYARSVRYRLFPGIW